MITIFQHGKDESPGGIANSLQRRGLPFEIQRLFETGEIPDILPARLILLGGQMSVNDAVDYPYFTAEKELIRKMVAQERPVLGICLGAQMIASAFGEEVYPREKELGWCRVHGCGQDAGPRFPASFTVFHWHNETFNLPQGATLLSYGDTVKNQAFRLGSAVGVQFHPEVTLPIITRWAQDLDTQEKQKILSESDRCLPDAARCCHRLVDAFARGWSA